MAKFRPTILKPIRLMRGIDEEDKKIYITSIGNMSGQALYEYFKYYGEIDFVRIFTDSLANSKGHGIISFKNVISANKVLVRTSYHIRGQRVYVKPLNNHLDEFPCNIPSNCKIYVCGITQYITDHDIISHFSQFGRIIHVLTPTNSRRTRRKEYSFVSFANTITVDNLLKFYPFHSIKGVPVNIYRVYPQPAGIPHQPPYLPEERTEFRGGVNDGRRRMCRPYPRMVPRQ